jgi:hypothetical protein
MKVTSDEHKQKFDRETYAYIDREKKAGKWERRLVRERNNYV